jgi:hypothetical protein
MQEYLDNCPLCSSSHFIFKSDIIDYALTKETFTIHECQNCSLQFTNPRPNTTASEKYYEYPTYASHKKEEKTIQDFIYNQIRKYSLKQKLRIVNKLTKEKGKLLDYGTGIGYFALTASNDGWETYAVEPNKKALKNTIFSNTVKQLEDLNIENKYKIITLFHVLEHIHSLKETLHNLVQQTETNGYILLALPNPLSYDAGIYKQFWAAYDVPRHLYHFNEKSIDHLAKINNLIITEKKTMPFDSYYVSLLSETYKNPDQLFLLKWIKAIYNGYRSNQKAFKDINKSSSILYILKKK